MEIILTDENFEKEIQAAKLPLLVDFFAVWCPPCSTLRPILEELAHEMEGKFILGKLNVDQAPKISQQFNIESIPAVYLFQAGKPVGSFVGAMPKEAVKDWLAKNI